MVLQSFGGSLGLLLRALGGLLGQRRKNKVAFFFFRAAHTLQRRCATNHLSPFDGMCVGRGRWWVEIQRWLDPITFHLCMVDGRWEAGSQRWLAAVTFHLSVYSKRWLAATTLHLCVSGR